MLHDRAAGILLAVSSLPSPYGIGSFGEDARQWLRFLHEAGQKYWQILPLGPTGWGDSPYQSFSAFAISPYYIDLRLLVERGLLHEKEISSPHWGKKADAADYAALYNSREKVLRLAFDRFVKNAFAKNDFDSFCAAFGFWLDDYSLFMALKQQRPDNAWFAWSDDIKKRDTPALEKTTAELAGEIKFHSFVQFLAFTQWRDIKEYARSLGISVIGDIPIYVAADSADAWANSSLFLLDENRKPLRVAGCPPDPFSAAGQLWGNPLYRWDLIAETGFSWWISRLRYCFELYDIVRIDHFRGFESYFSIDAGAHTAADGEWVRGPGLPFIHAIRRDLPDAAIIAEDLGFLTPEVTSLLASSGYPGMKVLQFAFDSREAGSYMPFAYERNCVVYTGTHDNSTSLGWFQSASADDVHLALDFFGLKNGKDGNWAFIRAALASAANTAVIPMQDYLGLDDRARMNIPSTLGGNNWRWRMLPKAAGPALAKKIRRLTAVFGR
jgi:4-alpha-glucanotransferase